MQTENENRNRNSIARICLYVVYGNRRGSCYR